MNAWFVSLSNKSHQGVGLSFALGPKNCLGRHGDALIGDYTDIMW